MAQAFRTRVALISIALVSALMLMALPSAPAEARLPGALTEGSGTYFEVRPPVIGYTGDGTGYLGGKRSTVHNLYRGSIDWKQWNHHKANGRARAFLNRCRPSCASGNFYHRKATVKLRRARHGRFTRMYIHTRGNTDRRILTRIGSYWVWGICGTKYTRRCR